MNLSVWLLILIILSSFLTGVLVLLVPEDNRRLRTVLNLFGAFLKLGLVIWLVAGVYNEQLFETRWQLAPGLELLFRADELSVLFVSLSAALWLITTIYAIGYMESYRDRSRFFGFFSFCVTATVGLALAGNLFTFVVFYEVLTLATYPLVAHKGTEAAIRGARIYLTYTLVGGLVLLIGVIALESLTGPIEFTHGGVLMDRPELNETYLSWVFFIIIAGLGVKAALVPLHGWLPQAMVAPAPVSALLHAVAVVKAGAFGIVRVVYDVYGVEYADNLGVLVWLGAAAALTIVYGSVRALSQDNLKKRLAYSTVSQVSYIALGTAIVGPLATVGGIVHLVHQGMMKITLFFAAGNYAESLGIHKVSEMNGVGRRMPGTTLAFTVASLGMIGVPPIAGFFSKWYIGLGALEAGQAVWVLPVLLISSALNAAYFLPILYRVWFLSDANDSGQAAPWRGVAEVPPLLLWPPLVTASLALLFGVFVSAPFSPFEWAQLIAAREYGQ